MEDARDAGLGRLPPRRARGGRMNDPLRALDRWRPYSPLLVRGFVGFVLVYGTQDNVFHAARMLEFRDFLAANGFPYPLFCAHLSVYAQFAAGIGVLAGVATRWAALAMVVNFAVALAMVHVGLPFAANVAPLAMLAGSLYLLVQGPGPFALGEALRLREDAVPVRSLPGAG